MMKWNILVISFLMIISATAQPAVAVLNVKVINGRQTKIDVIKPVMNAVFWAARQQVDLDKDGKCSITLDSTELGYLILFAKGKRWNVYMMKGDSIDMIVDTSHINTVSFFGKNASGQLLLNDKRIPLNYYEVKSRFSGDSSLKSMTERIEKEKIDKINLFGTLYDVRQIDSSFFSFAKLNLDYLYANVIADIISDDFYRMFYPPSHPLYKASFNKEYEQYWQLLLQYFPPDHPNAYSLPSIEAYTDHFIDRYVVDYKRWLTNDTLRLNHDVYLMKKIEAIKLNFKGAMADLTEARRLYLNYIQEKFEKPLIGWYENFQNRSNVKKYLPYLQPYHQKVVAYHNAVNKNFDAKQIFIKNYMNINQFEKVKEQLKGNIYYVDIWATWCGPCKQEFKYKDSLERVLSRYKIKTLYLSMDKDEQDADWKTMIRFFQLNGTHLRTNNALRTDLSRLFWGGDGYAIPRYLLIGTDGTVLESDSARPSDVATLRKQIEKHLKSNQSN